MATWFFSHASFCDSHAMYAAQCLLSALTVVTDFHWLHDSTSAWRCWSWIYLAPVVFYLFSLKSMKISFLASAIMDTLMKIWTNVWPTFFDANVYLIFFKFNLHILPHKPLIQSSLLDHRHLLVLPYHCWSSFLLLTIKTMVLCIIVFSSHFLLDLNLWMFWISAVFSLVETIPLSNLSIMMDQLHMLATKFLNLRASFLM